MNPAPFLSFFKTLYLLFRGRLHFPRHRIGEVLIMGDGLPFTIFRHAIVDPTPEQPEKPGVIFRVRFQVKNMSPEQNKRFSLLPIPFFIGLPGFRAKLWAVNERTGYSMGIYQWDTESDAQNYANSFAMQFMKKRSVPRSLSYEITPTRK